jgi:hypothetical protein
MSLRLRCLRGQATERLDPQGPPTLLAYVCHVNAECFDATLWLGLL